MPSKFMNNQSPYNFRRPCKKLQMQGAQDPRSEAYFCVRCNNEGRSATQHMDFLRGRHA